MRGSRVHVHDSRRSRAGAVAPFHTVPLARLLHGDPRAEALESGDPAAARAYWEQLLPFSPPADTPRTWLGVPDTEIDLASIRARLVMASIFEGAAVRAKDELAGKSLPCPKCGQVFTIPKAMPVAAWDTAGRWG